MRKSKVVVITLIVLAVLAVVTLSVLTLDGIKQEDTRDDQNRIVVINLNGLIQEGQLGFMAEGISPNLVRSRLDQVAADHSIDGVVLRIQSQGGSIAASQEIAQMVSDFEKPIVVSMADMAASGGYYISAYAQGIVAQPGTMTGSIGVISTVMNLEGLYEMIGVEVETFKSGEHKDMFNSELSEEERQIMQDISDEAYEQFISDVAQGRELPLEQVRELATGQLYIGSQALELGLVDRLGGVEEAIDFLAELNKFENPVRYDLPQPSLFDQMFGFGYQTVTLLEKALLGPELIKLEMLREGFPPDIRYQVW
ncbi:MAG: signal peptide peptidase SppA [Bacillota bacterium]